MFLLTDTSANMTHGVFPSVEMAQECVRNDGVFHYQIEDLEKGEIIDWSDDRLASMMEQGVEL